MCHNTDHTFTSTTNIAIFYHKTKLSLYNYITKNPPEGGEALRNAGIVITKPPTGLPEASFSSMTIKNSAGYFIAPINGRYSFTLSLFKVIVMSEADFMK